jgi:hypothetical protein
MDEARPYGDLSLADDDPISTLTTYLVARQRRHPDAAAASFTLVDDAYELPTGNSIAQLLTQQTGARTVADLRALSDHDFRALTDVPALLVAEAKMLTRAAPLFTSMSATTATQAASPPSSLFSRQPSSPAAAPPPLSAGNGHQRPQSRNVSPRLSRALSRRDSVDDAATMTTTTTTKRRRRRRRHRRTHTFARGARTATAARRLRIDFSR